MIFGAIAALSALSGCSAERPVNPSFPLTRETAHQAIAQMQHDAKALPHPVVVLGGIHDPGFAPAHIADVVRDSVPDRTQVIDVAFFGTLTFDSCAEKLIHEIDASFPGTANAATAEVDVIGFSMGGLVARYAASDAYFAKSGRRLRIARLFTISTPHAGADLADLPTFDQRAEDMREGSAFLATLNATRPAEETFEVFAYVRLHDGVVGEEHAAPPGQTAWWVPSGFTLAHTLAGRDERILADILRRLRDEEPFATSPPAPLPETH